MSDSEQNLQDSFAVRRMYLRSNLSSSGSYSSSASSSLGTLSPVYPAQIRPASSCFDGRITIPKRFQFATASRSRRTTLPTGAIPGKNELGTSLQARIKERSVFLNPPKEHRYVNHALQGSIRIAFDQVEPPIPAAKRPEFQRCAVAQFRGGVFPRSQAGCPPYVP
ncbi:hypothetical protein GUITHDRAFT_151440 [Guillardia theta CCMP2712]|uniref:Uncharacterized protein n=2 Tax=Guillardia theta TaxID=55529 RepID=L1JN71_GUITC|nr:hypothetical protein GUITHDRAFT_151440 [Guillardia theta CCMP2712]EKX49724.1 hypothetical protein GUITHDRAFT_151440 [Guillardia theta CCMP2712]|mmetsp:Transcript_51717/g.160954  ORF Transcript_51717/g.160954 Transcript_51717/m.160954 type:complete len:166 (+) Transcript_51717:216-713(+)|eukprot:XP_005836704.1 hypothetical protein GUITHDRAFT_151440 [Guillardia theta CCMP2712]